MQLDREKIQKFIEYCNCLSEVDKPFWLVQLTAIPDQKLGEFLKVLLDAEIKLVGFELQSISKIHDLIITTYPELTTKYLPNYSSLYSDYEILQREATIDSITSIRNKINSYLH